MNNCYNLSYFDICAYCADQVDSALSEATVWSPYNQCIHLTLFSFHKGYKIEFYIEIKR